MGGVLDTTFMLMGGVLDITFMFMGGVLDTTLCDKVCQWLTAGWWFSLGTPIKLIDITEILLKVVLNTMTLTHGLGCLKLCGSQIDKDDF